MKNVDVLWFDHDCTYEDNIKNKHKKTRMEIFNFKEECIITPKEYANRALSVGSRDISFGWNGMIDFKHLITYNLHFIKQTIHEDVFFGISLFLSCKFISYLPCKLYNYRIRDNSLCDYSNQNKNTWISPYMKNIYNKFNNIEQTKFYFR